VEEILNFEYFSLLEINLKIKEIPQLGFNVKALFTFGPTTQAMLVVKNFPINLRP
jgi:hypothetical protein